MRPPRARVLVAATTLGLVALLAGVGLAAYTSPGGPRPGPTGGTGGASPIAVVPSVIVPASALPSAAPTAFASAATASAAPTGAASSPSASPWPLPSPSPSAPAGIPVPDPAKFGFAAKGMLGEVMAFVTVPELAYARDTLDLSAVSTLAFFSLQAAADGHLQHDSRWEAWNGPVFAAVLARAHAAGTRVVLSVSRFSWSPDETAATVTLLGSPARRARLATEIAAEVVRRGVDGVNVDLEPVPVGQKAAFTSFVRQLRTALDAAAPGLQLTVAITGYFSSYDVGRLTGPGAADAIYLMGYQYSGWWSKYAGSTSPMGGARLNVVSTVAKLQAAGVKPNQLIVGVPYYGHLWPTRSAAAHARTLGNGRDLSTSEALGILARYGRRWDPVEQSAWTTWKQGGTNYQLWVSDGPTLARQWGRFQTMGLLGTGIWSISKEGSPGSLNKALRVTWIAKP